MSEQVDANDRINGWLEKLSFGVISLGVTVTATFQWQLYQSNTEVKQLLKAHDAALVSLQSEVAAIKGQMVGWDTLKRIELFLSSQDPAHRGSALADAIKMERESRKQ